MLKQNTHLPRHSIKNLKDFSDGQLKLLITIKNKKEINMPYTEEQCQQLQADLDTANEVKEKARITLEKYRDKAVEYLEEATAATALIEEAQQVLDTQQPIHDLAMSRANTCLDRVRKRYKPAYDAAIQECIRIQQEIQENCD